MAGPGGVLGTTRNRTDLFLRYRNQALGINKYGADNSKDASRLLDKAIGSHVQNGASAAEMGLAGAAGALPPQYVDFKELTRSQMLGIKAKMGELRKLHGQAALTSFDDTNSKELEIEVVTQEVTRLFREAEKQLQRFGHQQSATAADDKVRRNVQRTLATELQNLSVQFRKQQKQHLNQLRQQKEGVSGSWLDAGPSGDPGDEYDPGFSDMQAMQASSMDALAEERDREVRNILTSIADLAQIMKDLSTLVIDQGTILDRIDYNMEQVSLKVEEGVGQLVKAEKSQRQSRMIMCIMFLVVAVIVMLLFVILQKLFF
jgi:syntaxin 16